MLGQRAAAASALLGAGALQRRIGLLLLGFGFGNRLFNVLQRKTELVGIEFLGAPAKLRALELADQMAQTVILAGKLVARGGELGLFGALGVAFGPDLDQRRAQRGDVVWQGLGGRVHGPIGPRN